jgi:hypothetical protein
MIERGQPMQLQKTSSPAADHRRQMIWQVWVPLGASILIILALMVLTIIGAVNRSDHVERWGNLSAVWVIIPVLISSLIFITILLAVVYGMSKLLKNMPEWMLKAQLGMVHIGLIVRRAADAATRPVMAVNGVDARAKTFWQRIFGKK